MFLVVGVYANSGELFCKVKILVFCILLTDSIKKHNFYQKWGDILTENPYLAETSLLL